MRNVTTRRRSRGFTAIELSIVVAVIGLLSALAIPAYQRFQVKAQVSEGMNALGAAKLGVAEFYNANGNWPTTNAQAGLPAETTGKYISALSLSSPGTLLVTFGNNANAAIAGQTIAMQPYLSTPGGHILWFCGHKVPPQGMASAAAAQNTSAASSPLTTLGNDYLTAECRA
jgi:type IV pilus assembly protein PilA